MDGKNLAECILKAMEAASEKQYRESMLIDTDEAIMHYTPPTEKELMEDEEGERSLGFLLIHSKIEDEEEPNIEAQIDEDDINWFNDNVINDRQGQE